MTMNCDWADVAVLNATGLNAASLKYNELEIQWAWM